MIQLTDSEAQLVSELLDCLQEAIVELPEMDLEYANKTKIQKLLFFAIDEFDIPITRSWYLAGAVVPDHSIGPSAFDHGPSLSPDHPPSPEVPSGMDQEDSVDESIDTLDDAVIDPILFTDTSDDDKEEGSPPDLSRYVDRNGLKEFYKEKIPDVWHQRTMRFLQNFYQESAPEEYRLLYVESTHLRTNLNELSEAIEQHLSGRSPDRPINTIRESIELSISDLHYYLRQIENLKETFEVFVEGTDLIEDVVLQLDQMNPDDLTQQHLKLVDELQDFFYSYVWKYPCLRVSQETSAGPQAKELRSRHAAEFEQFDEQVRQQLTHLMSKLSSAGLIPGPNDYPPFDDPQMAETLNDLSTEYLD